MKTKSCRAFLVAKGGLKVAQSADSISFDESLRRFAIADGVTQSYFPQFFSRALTKAFVEENDPAGQFFNAPHIADTFNKVIAEWDNNAIEAERNADELTRSLYDERRHDNPLGATTFAGVTVDDNNIEVVSIGDSCVFIVPDDKDISPVMITSMPHTVNDASQEMFFDCEFGSRPHFINTEGFLSTTPVSEVISPGACWLLMMTDAIAEWFVKHFDRNDNSETLKTILSLSSQEDFESFIASKRKDETLNDDDTSLVIVRFEQNADSQPSSAIFENPDAHDDSLMMECCDNIDGYSAPSTSTSEKFVSEEDSECRDSDKSKTDDLIATSDEESDINASANHIEKDSIATEIIKEESDLEDNRVGSQKDSENDRPKKPRYWIIEKLRSFINNDNHNLKNGDNS